MNSLIFFFFLINDLKKLHHRMLLPRNIQTHSVPITNALKTVSWDMGFIFHCHFIYCSYCIWMHLPESLHQKMLMWKLFSITYSWLFSVNDQKRKTSWQPKVRPFKVGEDSEGLHLTIQETNFALAIIRTVDVSIFTCKNTL